MVILGSSLTIFSSKFPFQSLEIDVDGIINRISSHRGVVGVMLFNLNGVAIKSNLDESQTNLWAFLVRDVVNRARVLGKSIAEGNNLAMLRIRTTKYEVMIAPEKEFIMVSLHKQINEQLK
jgi:dynein light chain roadblock-type